ncbi:unnamed protein product, partial [Iphiclides podalirius]
MVLTRSRAASPASAAAGVSPEGVVPPLFPAESAPESTPRDLEAAPAPPPAVSSDSDAVIADQGHALPLPPSANPAAAPITMTTEQLLLLINRLSPAVPHRGQITPPLGLDRLRGRPDNPPDCVPVGIPPHHQLAASHYTSSTRVRILSGRRRALISLT